MFYKLSLRGISRLFLFILLIVFFLTQNNISALAAVGDWTVTGSLNISRTAQSATLLSDGKVLIVGGFNGSTSFASAELYDPNTGIWSVTGSMNIPRREHIAILLPDGKVLVAGGKTDLLGLSSAEIYDPINETWTVTGSMNINRYCFAAALLPSGKVLVTGGWDYTNHVAINSSEIYDPVSGTWSMTGSMNDRRNVNKAILLPNGKVLVAGGEDTTSHYLNSAELYDPDTGIWTLTSNMNVAHGWTSSLTLLHDGKILLAGAATNSSSELFDPNTNTWSSTGSMLIVRRNHAATLLPDGKVLVTGGNQYFGPAAINSTEMYDPDTGLWTTDNPMNYAYGIPTATKLTNGKLLIVGGSTAELYTMTEDTPTVIDIDLETQYHKVGPDKIMIQFNKAVKDPPGDFDHDDVTNSDNYLLIEAGANKIFNTVSCLGGVIHDDVNISISNVMYNSQIFKATVELPNGLPPGTYRLLVCGTTSIVDLSDIPINNGADYIVNFSVLPAEQVDAATLPASGFAPGQVTSLENFQQSEVYTNTGLILNIPSIDVSIPITGVPRSGDSWDVSWLGNRAGYLYGSAYPTWTGNTVITGHVWNADNTPGIFSDVKALQYGDTIQVETMGQVYTYEVRENKLLTSTDVSKVFTSEDLDWITLITCEEFDPLSSDYTFRRTVRAVLITIEE